jgi:hypothetical protein
LKRVVVGFSGGVTSAWCAGWALKNFPREEVVLLWHDTKEEHPDTYRFLREMAAALEMPITERSDGRSVTELFHDENMLGNGQQTFCSRILKAEQGMKFNVELKAQGFEIVKVVGYSANEPDRVHRMVGRCLAEGVGLRFPIIEEKVTKQQCAEWCLSMGVKPSAMYCWADHANCIGCVKGGRAYWLAVHENHPEVFEQRAQLEEEFGHTIIRGGDREHVTLRQLLQVGLKRRVGRREQIEIGACDCGD